MANEADLAEADARLQRAGKAYREERYVDAETELTRAAEVYRAAGETSRLAVAVRNLGEIGRRRGQLDAAETFYEEAVKLHRQVGDPLRLAHTVRHRGDVLFDQKRLDRARQDYEEALGLYRQQDEPLQLANALRSFAILLEATGEKDTAREHWSETRDLYRQCRILEGVAETSLRLASLATDHAEAEKLLLEAKEAADASGDPDSQAHVAEVTRKIRGKLS